MPLHDTDLAIKALELFNALTGAWSGTTRTWFEPEVLADESPSRAVARLLPESRFLIIEYEATLQENPYHGLLLCSFNLFSQDYEATWVDSFHMTGHMMILKGEEAGQGFSVLGSYHVGEAIPDWGWRIEVRLLTPEQFIITMYNITPDGFEAKGVETIYHKG